MKSTGVAYLLLALGLLLVCGLHRFYVGKWKTGLLWLLTGGLLGIGQIIDIFLVPGMVRQANADNRLSHQGYDQLNG
ncbi:NINE protein [Notoacmeibacter ruber]|uniref:NINE protein n=1 Tax=Notoacmeibacter ruber TaxID=2670375 RepID=A0A3L7J9Y3_9HYPH|nr:NINE protein [Notoacmeibacter ruber]RLQ87503.1 NINE protein [Notoacmeibacter ruber]